MQHCLVSREVSVSSLSTKSYDKKKYFLLRFLKVFMWLENNKCYWKNDNNHVLRLIKNKILHPIIIINYNCGGGEKILVPCLNSITRLKK